MWIVWWRPSVSHAEQSYRVNRERHSVALHDKPYVTAPSASGIAGTETGSSITIDWTEVGT